MTVSTRTLHALSARFTTMLIGYVYSVGQARGMGLVGQYVFGLDIIPMIVVMMAITVGYLDLSGMLGATKNMAVQYAILIVAFLAGCVRRRLLAGVLDGAPADRVRRTDR